MNKYLVGFDDWDINDFFTIEASSEAEAKTLFCKEDYLTNIFFLEHVGSRIVNASFGEQFYFVTKEENRVLEQTGEVIVSNSILKKRIEAFFQNTKWSNIYYNYLMADDVEDEPSAATTLTLFPEAMLWFIYSRVKNEWFHDISIKKIS